MNIALPIAIMLATSVVVAARSRPISAISIGACYALQGVLLWAGTDRTVSIAYLIAGLTVGSIIWLSGAQMPSDWQLYKKNTSSSGSLPLGWFFLALTLVLCAVVAYGLSSTYPLSDVRVASEWESFIAYWLLVTGLFAAGITRSPLWSGLGLLLLLCGASVSYILLTEDYRSIDVLGILLVGILLTMLLCQPIARRIDTPEAQVE